MSIYTNDANLEGYWQMGEASGNALDSDPNGNDLTDNNTVGAASSGGNNWRDFESGTSEYFSIADGSQVGLDITGSISILTRILTESHGTDSYVITKGTLTGNQRGYAVYLTATQVRFELSSNGTATTALSVTHTITNGTEYSLAAVYDGTDMRLYVDGSLIGSPQAYSSGLFNNTGPFHIGARGDGGSRYDGLQRDGAVFSRALSAAEVSSWHSEGILAPTGQPMMLRGTNVKHLRQWQPGR